MSEDLRDQWPTAPERNDGGGAGFVLGALLICGGILGTVYFLLFFSTGADNLGLLQDRQLGVIVSVVAVLIGTIMVIFSGNRRG